MRTREIALSIGRQLKDMAPILTVTGIGLVVGEVGQAATLGGFVGTVVGVELQNYKNASAAERHYQELRDASIIRQINSGVDVGVVIPSVSTREIL